MAREVMIVVPCYNEEKRLDTGTFKTFAGLHDNVGFLFVNDGSTDNTASVLEDLHYSDPCSFLAHHLPANAGKAEAVRQGILKAMELSPAHVGYWDADLATPLEEIPNLCRVLETMGHVQAVFGSRVMLLGRSIRRSSLRHYLGRLFATTVSFVLGLQVYDTQCGAKLFRASEEVRELFDEPFQSTWIFDVEIIARWIRARANGDLAPVSEIIYEIPLAQWHGKAGSKIDALAYARSAVELVGICRRYVFSARPR
ncbi:MAG: glycosyltransferase [Thermodesulfobacteriota bacterium]